jgi:Zn-dependent peptidase ImmA (M78 family)/DNA-binding XRE family transcriptional regulator
MPFDSARLSIARKRRMLNKKGFAEALGVAQHTASRWERGDTEEPSPENIEAISRLLQFPREFFEGSTPDEPEAASFRSQTSMSAAIRDAAFAAGSIGFLISDWTEERFNLPPISVPDLHLYDPEHAASALRAEWKIGERPISNMIHLLESKGVRVFSLAENTVKLNAYSIWRREKPYIFLNTFKSAESSRFDAAHELAHLVLHQDGKTNGRKAEDQAHLFAASFLMPKADVFAHLPRVTHVGQMVQAKRRWGVSVAALNYRVHKLEIITDWKYRDFCIEISTRQYNRYEPNNIERERSSVWEKVLKALWSERITQADIARMLHVPESEVSGLLFGVVAASTVKPISGHLLSVV